MKKTRIYITMLCVILTMLVIFILPAVADEVILDGSNNIYGDDYKPVETDVVYGDETDFVYGNETDFEGGKDTEWVGVETDVFPEETEEIVYIVMDNMNKIYDNNSIYELRVSASGAPTSSFVMELGLPWFVTVKGVRINDELMMVENAICEKSFDENHLSISYSSPVNFAETDLFYIEYMINATGEHHDSAWVNFAQFVNDDVVEVEYSFKGGIFNISDKKMIKGDVNLDGYIRLDDVMLMLRHLAGYEMNFSDIQWSAADVDNDGSITIIDCQYIQNYIVGKIDSLENVNGCKHLYDENGKCMLCGEYGGSGDEPSIEPEQPCKHVLTSEKIIKEPNCTQVGHVQYACQECGYMWKEVIEPNGKHVYDENGVCKYCGEGTDIPEAPECEHLKATVVKSSEPTCIKNGFAQYQCPECGYMWKETIPATDYHNYDINGVCIDCGKGTDIPEAPECKHLKATVVKSSEPTCIKNGFAQYQCPECGYMWKETIPATDYHNYDSSGVCIDCGEGVVNPEAPNCNGLHVSNGEGVCVNCGIIKPSNEYMDDYVYCTHDDRYVVETLEPTCGKSGYIWYNCGGCSYKWKQIILATEEHKYDAKGICVNCGKVDGKPMECDHPLAYAIQIIAPDCIGENYVEFKCPDCHLVWEETIVVEARHYYDENFVCRECGYQPECKHIYVEAEWINPTCGEHGYVWYQCINCGDRVEKYLYGTHAHRCDANGNCMDCDIFVEGTITCDHSHVLEPGYSITDCVNEGFLLYYCIDCRQRWEVVIPCIEEHLFEESGRCKYCNRYKDKIESGYYD